MKRAPFSARSLVARLVASLSTAALIVACSDTANGPVTLESPFEGGVNSVTLGGVGATCDDATPCRPGLACTSGKCQPGHSLDDGTPCIISDECKMGDFCGPDRTCKPAGMGSAGDTCRSDADCKSGLRCNIVGLSAQCAPEGMGDVGAACKASTDCFEGLACAGGKCTPLPPGAVVPLAIPTWPGADCSKEDTSNGAIAYFQVPRDPATDGDFFRLPFPNDVRLKNGHPDLTSFPTPGSEILGYDVVDRYARYVEQTADGWSTYSSIIFRFNQEPDLNTLSGMGVLRMVDLTASQDVGFSWSATTAQGKYVCANSVTARPALGAPFAPGHTYAFLMSTAVQTKDKKPFGVAPDLAALLKGTAPSDPKLAAAYTAYKPLRDWAAAQMPAFDLNSILDTTVFTVGHPAKLAQDMQTAVAAAPAPAATMWTLCDGTNKSPCAQADGDRACPTKPNAMFDELHALVSLPIFQKGTAPYSTPTDGGDVTDTNNKLNTPTTDATICMSLTVPHGLQPSGGWPILIYAHGTGGSFRSQVTDGVSALLPQTAVLGIDQVEHGPRRGASMGSPNDLFFNFTNPSAARGNPLQGAADQMSLARLATGLTLAKNSVGGAYPTADVKFAPVMFWGHSQGATEGGIGIPYTPGISGAVLSGEGASLIDGLLGKRSPVDVADVIPFVLEDTDVGAGHPVLTVLQNAIDPADPLNHAAAMVAIPVAPATGVNVFQIYGQKDTYAPPVTQNTYAVAAGLQALDPPASNATNDKITDDTTKKVPFGGNYGKTMNLTGVIRQYSPQTYDGHFVAFQNPDAQKDIFKFMTDVGTLPAIVPITVGQ
jgi:hypothetical protein